VPTITHGLSGVVLSDGVPIHRHRTYVRINTPPLASASLAMPLDPTDPGAIPIGSLSLTKAQALALSTRVEASGALSSPSRLAS
jgi:hypothetical protein